MARKRAIFIAAAAAASLAVASPAMADEGDPLPGGDPIAAPADQGPERVVPAAEGDPLPSGDPEKAPASDEPERVVRAEEGDPLPGGDPEKAPASDEPERVVPREEGDPLRGGDPAPKDGADPVRMTASYVLVGSSHRAVARHAKPTRRHARLKTRSSR